MRNDRFENFNRQRDIPAICFEKTLASISLTCVRSPIGSNWNSVETKTVYRKLAVPRQHRQAPRILGLQTTSA
jgi:hypothetical protein